jgi:glycosyltransferase involved in cell wall biosynthesis
MLVNIVCRNLADDRVLPRFARYLAAGLGWTLTSKPIALADVYYLMGYFESQMFATWPPVSGWVASLFTHREEEPAGNAKAALYDQVAHQVDVRVAMSHVYRAPLSRLGPTIQPPLPVEQDHFTIATRSARRARPLVGLAGYTYANARKGEDLVAAVLSSSVGRSVDWVATGRGWPVRHQKRPWAEMPRFYQALDVFVCPSRVEGGPMTVLEALACGVPVVVPRGVGLIDELPHVVGIHRYRAGDRADLISALHAAAFPQAPVDREALRRAVAAHTVGAWCQAHARGFAEAFR